MAQPETTPANNLKPVDWSVIGPVFAALPLGFFTVVMMAIEGGGPQGFVEKGILYSAGAAMVVAPISLWGIHRKGSFAGFVLSAGLTLSTFALAAASFALF
jgi:hypothetical protein